MADDRRGDGLTGVAAELRSLVAGFEPGRLDGEAAVQALEVFGELERLAAAGKALAAHRVEVTRAWQSRGVRSAAHFVASTCGSSVRSAVETLETARRLDDLPATAEALRSGKLSSAQVSEIVSAAGARPEVEAELVASAGSETLPALQQRCRAVRAEGAAGREAYVKVRAKRYLRHWSDAEGALCLAARLCPDDGAKVLAAIDTERRRIFATGRRDGRREPFDGLRGRRPGGAGREGERRRNGQTGSWGHGPRPGRPRLPGPRALRRRRDVRHPGGGAHPGGHRPGPGRRLHPQGAGDQGGRRGWPWPTGGGRSPPMCAAPSRPGTPSA